MAGITNRRKKPTIAGCPRAKRVSLVDPRDDPGANLVPHCSIFREAFQVPAERNNRALPLGDDVYAPLPCRQQRYRTLSRRRLTLVRRVGAPG